MNGGGRAGEVVDLIDPDVQGESDVVAHQLEALKLQDIGDVVLPSSKEIVDVENVVALGDEPLAQVRVEESCTACHQDPLRGRFHVRSSSQRPSVSSAACAITNEPPRKVSLLSALRGALVSAVKGSVEFAFRSASGQT
jgi:hypothetical protein